MIHMISKFLSGIVIFTLISILFIGLASNPVEAQSSTTWTYMVYMSGDSSLANNIPADIQEMQEVGSGNGLEIIVISDSSGEQDSKLARIMDDGQEEIPLTDIDSAWDDELEMGDSDTLSKFVIWAAENYPADRYILDLWGHGLGWAGVCPDKDNYLQSKELRTAMEDVKDSGIELDIISMDACQMGMFEIAYELRDMADYAILSEKDVPLDGWPYDDLLNLIRSDMNITLEDFGRKMIDSYMDWGVVSSRYSLTLSFIDLAEIDEVASTLSEYSDEAIDMVEYFNPQFIEARSLTEEYDGAYQYDLRHLLANINSQTKCKILEKLAENINNGLDNAITYERHWTNIQDEPADYASGLSIWFPPYSPSGSYLECSFAQDTGWDEFLDSVASFFSEPGRQEIVNNVQAIGLDLDGNNLKDAIKIDYDANSIGMTIVELYGPNNELLDSFELDTSSSGSQTIELENYGAYSVAVYLWGNTGTLRNYSLFNNGLAREGVSIISGEVVSDIGRGMSWVQVSLVNSHGDILTSTNTDTSGYYTLEVIVPTHTDGSNLTLTCGLGEGQQNITIEALSDDNTINFQLETSNLHIGTITAVISMFIIIGLVCLVVWGIVGRKKEPVDFVETIQDSHEEEQKL